MDIDDDEGSQREVTALIRGGWTQSWPGSELAISLAHRILDPRDRGGMLGIPQDTLETVGSLVIQLPHRSMVPHWRNCYQPIDESPHGRRDPAHRFPAGCLVSCQARLGATRSSASPAADPDHSPANLTLQ